MKTYISDTFPLRKIDCQYFDICRDYNPKVCNFVDACELRQWFKQVIEPYMPKNNLEIQVQLILDETKKQPRKEN